MAQQNRILRKEDFSLDDLKMMVGPKIASTALFIVWDKLTNYPSVRELFKEHRCVVLLLQLEGDKESVGHFVLLIDFGSYLEHFDSYGFTMEEELSIVHEHHLTRMFKDYRKPIHNNTKRLQTMKKDINTCGRWVVARLMLQHLSLDEFLKYIHYYRGIAPDDLVTLMTVLLQIGKPLSTNPS